MTCYSSSRHFLTFALVAVVLAVFCGWVGVQFWAPWFIASFLFFSSAALLIFLVFQPPIEVYEHHLAIGKKIIPWSEILRLDRTSWVSPLIVKLTLTGDRRVTLPYPGDIDAGKSLLRHLRRCAREALIDGIPYKVVTWSPAQKAPSGHTYQVVGYINAQSLVERVETCRGRAAAHTGRVRPLDPRRI